MTHTRVPKRVAFSPNGVDISDISSGKLIAIGLVNHHAKTYEFSKFLSDAKPTTLLTHGNEVSRLWHEIFGHLNFKNIPWKVSQPSKPPVEFAKVTLSKNTLSTNLIEERKTV